jgi:CHAT domain-containing protein
MLINIKLLCALVGVGAFLTSASAQNIPIRPNAIDAEGLKTGDWVYYYDRTDENTEKRDSAATYRLITYKKGQPDGKVRNYFKDGRLQFEATLYKEIPELYDGEAILYSREGHPVKFEFYEAGVLNAEKSITRMNAIVAEHKQNISTHTSYATSLNNLAILYHGAGRNVDVERLHMQAIAIYKENLVDSYLDYALCLNSLGSFYYGMCRHSETEPLFLEALKIRKEILGETNAWYLVSLNNLASLYKVMGRYAEAEPLYKQTLQIKKIKVGESAPSYAVTLNNLAQLYELMGRFAEAEPLYKQSLNIRKENVGENNPTYALSLSNLAQLYSSMERYGEAEPLLQQALEIFRATQGETHPNVAIRLNNLGKLYLNTGRYAEAESFLHQALKIYKEKLGEGHPNYAASLFGLAKLYQTMDTLPQLTLSYYEHALAISQKVYGNNHPNTSTIQAGLASFHYNRGEVAQALVLFASRLDFLENYVHKYFNYLGESEREAFYTNLKDDFEQYTELSFREYQTHPELLATAYNLQLRYKALLLSTTNLIKQRIISSGDRQLIALYDEIQALKQMLGKTAALSDQEFLLQRGVKRDTLEQVLANKDQQLTQLSGLYANESKLPTWEDVRAKLGKKEAVVEIIRFRNYDYLRQEFTKTVNYAALIVTAGTKEHPEVVFFDNGDFLENKAISFYRNSMQVQTDDPVSYENFWKPLKTKLKKIEKVYFSPDGVFHSINMKTLFNSKTSTYFRDEIELELITSSKDLLLAKEASMTQKLGFLIGNPAFGGTIDITSTDRNSIFNNVLASIERGESISPLPGTEKEVQQIQSLLKKYQWRETTLLDEHAKEETLKKMLKPNVLHIASHGFFRENVDGKISYGSNPLYRSGILLSGAAETLQKNTDLRGNVQVGKEDGILTAFEALNLNIDNTDLVVLSACETGLGEIHNGEGVFGLQRAFKLAGARTILMSLWKVDDQTTQELMVIFYAYWLNGVGKREAFDRAQTQLRAKYPHPYYWGAFVIIGE